MSSAASKLVRMVISYWPGARKVRHGSTSSPGTTTSRLTSATGCGSWGQRTPKTSRFGQCPRLRPAVVSLRRRQAGLARITALTTILLIASPLFAQNYHYGMITQELSASEADAVQRVGAGWVVLNFNWDEVDRRCP